jgi:hypothetical protein
MSRIPGEEAVGGLCEAAMRGFAAAVNAATPESPLRQTKVRLGDRFYTVAAEALRAEMKGLLIERREQVHEDLKTTPQFGEVAARAALVEVVANAIQAVIAAA